MHKLNLMEEFNIGVQSPKPSLSSEINSNMELYNNLASSMEGFNTNHVQGIMPLSSEGFAAHRQSHLPMSYNDEIQRSNSYTAPVFDPTHFFASSIGYNGLSMALDPENQINPSPSVSGTGFLGANKNYGGRKRKKISEGDMEKPREVVHVRAKRGQATDSHSLAERLRREKINEKLRCLQDLVPGCYKTMGMAVMLDVIINYVRSLQNQIDFLSMKLSAASLFYDFNSSEAEAMEAMQEWVSLQATTGYPEQGIEKLEGEDYGGISNFQMF